MRELQNVIERGVIVSTGPSLELGDLLLQGSGSGEDRIATLAELISGIRDGPTASGRPERGLGPGAPLQ